MNKHARLAAIGTTAAAATLAIGTLAVPALAGGHKHKHKHQHSSAPAAVSGVTSATYGYSLTITGLPDSSAALDVTGTATVDVANKAAEITATLSRAVGPIPAGEIDAIVSNHTIYVSAPGLSLIDGGKQWISMSGHGHGHKAGTSGAAWSKLSAALGNVPVAITWATSHPSSSPLATVTSTSTSGSSTTTSLLLHLPHMKAHAAGSTVLPTSIPLTVTTDSSGRLASASSSLTIGSVNVSASITSTGYNQPVSITVPAASDVATISPSLLAGIASAIGIAHHTASTGGSWLHGASASLRHFGAKASGDWHAALKHLDHAAS